MGCCDKIKDLIKEIIANQKGAYFAYASDSDGTNFSLTDPTGRCYLGAVILPIDATPVAADFAGKWVNLCGSSPTDIELNGTTLTFTFSNGATFDVDISSILVGATDLILLTGEAIAANKAIVLINGLAFMFDGSNPAHLGMYVGFSKEAKASGQNLKVAIPDTILDGFSGLVVGDRYYIANSGNILNTPMPIVNGNVIQHLGIAKTSTQLLIVKGDPVLYQ